MQCHKLIYFLDRGRKNRLVYLTVKRAWPVGESREVSSKTRCRLSGPLAPPQKIFLLLCYPTLRTLCTYRFLEPIQLRRTLYKTRHRFHMHTSSAAPPFSPSSFLFVVDDVYYERTNQKCLVNFCVRSRFQTVQVDNSQSSLPIFSYHSCGTALFSDGIILLC